MSDETILQEAQRIVHGARNEDYGHPLENHTRTANGWRWYLHGKYGVDVPLTPEDVCYLNIVQKLSRSMQRITRDTNVDVAGFAANVEMIQDKRGETP